MGSVLTVAQVADQLRVCRMTVYRAIASGDLPAVRVGKLYRIEQSALRSYLKGGRRGSRRRAGKAQARGVLEGGGGVSEVSVD